MKQKEIKECFYATGKKKKAIACIRLYPGLGNLIINNKNLETYCQTEYTMKIAISPLLKLKMEKKVDITCKVFGGGIIGQAYAISLGISRALEKMNQEFRKVLKKSGYLTRNSKIKERKKPGQPKARKKFQFSKR